MNRSEEGASGLGVAIVVLVLAGLAGWYFYSMPTSPSAVQNQQQAQIAPDAGTDAASDLSQVPSDNGLDQDAASLDKDINSLQQ